MDQFSWGNADMVLGAAILVLGAVECFIEFIWFLELPFKNPEWFSSNAFKLTWGSCQVFWSCRSGFWSPECFYDHFWSMEMSDLLGLAAVVLVRSVSDSIELRPFLVS